jgi:hypothetical protein
MTRAVEAAVYRFDHRSCAMLAILIEKLFALAEC